MSEPTYTDDLPDRIRSFQCEKCSEPIDDGVDSILSFCGGSFIRLHEECADYMEHATKGPRRNPRKWSNV
jgi:hypothetical protein